MSSGVIDVVSAWRGWIANRLSSVCPPARTSPIRLARNRAACARVVNAGLPALDLILRHPVEVNRLLIQPDFAVGAEHLRRFGAPVGAALPNVLLGRHFVMDMPAITHDSLSVS